MKHRKMESMLIISSDDKNQSDVERIEVIERVLDIYLKKNEEEKLNFEN